MNPSILMLTDGYKVTHSPQYPPGTRHVYSYFESRGGNFDEVTFFGLSYYIQRYLAGKVVTQEAIDKAEPIIDRYFGRSGLFNRKGWEYILKEHDGKLPVSIKAIPEGTTVPTKNVLMTVENTDPKCHWLTNYLETLLVQVWYPSTVCTLSREIKKMIASDLERTSDVNVNDVLMFKLHDFGFRGVSSVESAGIGGLAHLVNFDGTDTLPAVLFAEEYYNGQVGSSIPASEHSTITSWGKEHELAAYANMLNQYPTGAVACVSDSYNIFKACSDLWGNALKDRILNRDGILVVRPDSGEPVQTVMKVLETLGKAFGTTANSKGYNELPPQIRVIQGDGVDLATIRAILFSMEMGGWSADNIAFGMGGALLQKLHRDTQKFAFKCSSINVNDEDRDVFKDPITDPGKSSKKGKLQLINYLQDGKFHWNTIPAHRAGRDQLREVFRNGTILSCPSMDSVRGRAAL